MQTIQHLFKETNSNPLKIKNFSFTKGYSAKKGMLKNTIVRIAILIVLIFLKL